MLSIDTISFISVIKAAIREYKNKKLAAMSDNKNEDGATEEIRMEEEDEDEESEGEQVRIIHTATHFQAFLCYPYISVLQYIYSHPSLDAGISLL